METLISLLSLLVLAGILWLIVWIVDMVPLPAPIGLIIKIIAGILIIVKALALAGVSF